MVFRLFVSLANCRKIICHFVFIMEFVCFDHAYEEFKSLVIPRSILAYDLCICGRR
jgi:hypothetical protein